VPLKESPRPSSIPGDASALNYAGNTSTEEDLSSRSGSVSGYRRLPATEDTKCESAQVRQSADEEPSTLGGVEVLKCRLARALYEIERRDRRISELEHEIEMLRKSDFSAPPAPPASPDAPPLCEATATSSGGQIQWHSITVVDTEFPRPSLPPSQRKDVRRVVELPVEFDSETQFYAGMTQDISEGGVFIATYRVLPVGTQLGLSFELPCSTKIVARGEVRWIRAPSSTSRPGMGIAFLELSAQAIPALSRFCHQNAPLYMEF